MTCVSLSFCEVASEARSDDDKYRFRSNAVSRLYTCRRENTVRVFLRFDLSDDDFLSGDSGGDRFSALGLVVIFCNGGDNGSTFFAKIKKEKTLKEEISE